MDPIIPLSASHCRRHYVRINERINKHKAKLFLRGPLSGNSQKVHYLTWGNNRGTNMFQPEKGKVKCVHHSLQSKKFERVNLRPSGRCVYLCECVFSGTDLSVHAEQPRLCMNLAAYQLTFKLEPQSDCRPRGSRSHLIGCFESDLLTIEINRGRWAYPRAEGVREWGER